MKTIKWVGTSRDDVRQFPQAARHETGVQLLQVQLGYDPDNWKPMPSVGAGVKEIRIHAEGTFRVIYVAKFPEAVYVLHAFQKKTQKTSKQDIELMRQRLKDIARLKR